MIHRLLILATLTAPPVASHAVELSRDLVFDLAEQVPGVTGKRPILPDVQWKVKVINHLPENGIRYQVDIELANEPIDELRPLSGGCVDAENDFKSLLKGVSDERGVPDKVAEARKQAREKGCETEMEHAIEKQTTLRVSEPQSVRRGESLVVTVRRLDDGKLMKLWKVIYSTGTRGEWQVMYGFAFIPDEDEEFFTRQKPGDPSTFVITGRKDREEWDFAPSIFFKWLPAKHRWENVVVGPTAGLGFDLDNPIVFGGLGITYNDNIMFTLGVVIHKQKRLDGKFDPGQEIMTNLESSQLEEGTFDANAYLGFAFRFGENPFKKKDGGQGESQ